MNIFKKLFCKHDYELLSSKIISRQHFDFECYITNKYKEETYICKKCGKKDKKYTRI